MATLPANPGCKKNPAPAPKVDGGSLDGNRDAIAADALRADTKPAVVCLPDAGDHRKGKAEACTCNDDCQSGFCADGVCCTSACTDACKSCGLLSSLGDCGFIPPGVSPTHAPLCDLSTPGTCGLDGKCDGQGGCRKFVGGTECVAGKCDGETVGGRSECDGKGRCAAVSAHNCYPFICDRSDNQCATQCTSDSLCAAGQKCQSQSCGKKSNGNSCPTGDGECASGHCADGVCCNVSCTGACVSCNQTGSLGSCVFIDPGIADPHHVCTASDKSTCGQTGLCDGFGDCSLFSQNTPCGTAVCSSSTQVSTARTCDGLGTCREAGLTDCSPFLCSGGVCNRDCSRNGDADCETGHACTATTIQGSTVMLCGKKKNGQLCAAAAECDSAQCVDGFCCESSCSGACRSCGVPGVEGRCLNVAAGATDPRNTCVDKGKPSCTTNGLCDGSGSCQKYPSGTICAPETCNAGLYTPPSSCNSTQQCIPPNSNGCAPYICNGSACYSVCKDNTQCFAGNVCSTSSCGLKTNGSQCSQASECKSNFCAQGVCCNSACTDACLTCNLSASKGTCTAVADGTPDPQGICKVTATATCLTTGLCKSGACANVDSGKNCNAAYCAADLLSSTPASACDGKGQCVPPTNITCPPFKCDSTTGLCKATCKADTDCVSPNTCANSSCGLKANGSACKSPSQCSSNFCTEGVCCNSACSDATTGTLGLCMSCTVSGSAGTCSPVPSGKDDAKKRCSATKSDPTAADCSNYGTCDGAGKCATWPSGTGCRPASCTGSTFWDVVKCNDKGICPVAVSSSCNPYVCSTSAACLTSCTVDTQCLDPKTVCLPTLKCDAPLADGAGCTTNTDCINGHCTEGYCCNSACPGGCESCALSGSLGKCTAKPPASAPRIANTCSQTAPSSCGTDGMCNGTASDTNTNVCEFYDSTNSCTASSCPQDTHFKYTACDKSGACKGKQVACPAGYLCTGGTCATSCTGDSSCDTAAGYACLGNLCKKKPGQSCTGSGDCAANNFCVPLDASSGTGKICCASACTSDIACGAKTSCAVGGASCNSHKNEACGTTTCATNHLSSTAAGTCDGLGGCTQVTTQCSPYLCSDTTKACLSQPCSANTDCDQGSGFTCIASKCQKAGQGIACTATNQCSSGLTCIDNFCCTSPTACGTCKSCAVPTLEGTCQPVASGTSDATCTTSPCGNTGKCNGAGACAKVSNGTACGVTMSCTAGKQTGGGSCTDGSCITPPDRNCSPYVCSATSCATSCGGSIGCDTNFTCTASSNGQCLNSDGQTCNGNGDCAHGNCGGGFCCASACTLSSNGCGNTGSCQSDGSCVKYAVGHICGLAAHCNGNTLVATAACDLGDNCTAATTDCGAYACVTTPTLKCLTTCSVDGDCSGSNVCVGGACGSTKANGLTCSRPAECTSGNCVSNGGGSSICCSGSCTPSACGNTGFCDGPSFTCSQHGVGDTCGAGATCVNNSFIPAETCDSSKTCNTTPQPCGLYLCNSTTGCPTSCSNSDVCVTGSSCDQNPDGSTFNQCI